MKFSFNPSVWSSFAAAAMNGMLTAKTLGYYNEARRPKAVAELAGKYADAMLLELQRRIEADWEKFKEDHA